MFPSISTILTSVSSDIVFNSKFRLFSTLGVKLSFGYLAMPVATTNIRATVAIDLTTFLMIVFF